VVWGLSLIGGPMAEDYAIKLKRGQLNVCTVYGVLFSPQWLKFVPGWSAISVSKKKLTTVKSGEYDLVWLNV
jgi:hypothetical protein